MDLRCSNVCEGREMAVVAGEVGIELTDTGLLNLLLIVDMILALFTDLLLLLLLLLLVDVGGDFNIGTVSG